MSVMPIARARLIATRWPGHLPAGHVLLPQMARGAVDIFRIGMYLKSRGHCAPKILMMSGERFSVADREACF